MTATKSAFKIGVFALCVLAVFLYFTYKLKGVFWGQEYQQIRISFEFVGQLEPGSAVRLAGVQIGYVDKISFVNRPVRKPEEAAEEVPSATGPSPMEKLVLVTARIHRDPQYTLRKNSKAKIGQSGIIGDYYIELSFGSGAPLGPDDMIEGESPFQLDDLAGEAVNVTSNLQQVLEHLNDIVGREENKESIGVAIKNIADFTERLNEITGGEKPLLEEFFQNINEFSAKINDLASRIDATMDRVDLLVEENRGNLRQTIKNAAEVSETLRQETGGNLREVLRNLRSISEKMDTFVNQHQDSAGQTIEEVRQASESFREAMEKINRILDRIESDGAADVLLGGATSAQSLKNTIDTANRITERVAYSLDTAKLIYEFRYYEEDESLFDDDNNWRNDVGVQFDLSPEFNLYLGGTDVGKETELELLLGYRYHFLTLKAGVIESEAALGLDVQPHRRLILSAEGVGLTDEDEERLDLHGRLQLHQNLFVTFGVQDVGDESFVNGGLRLEF